MFSSAGTWSRRGFLAAVPAVPLTLTAPRSPSLRPRAGGRAGASRQQSLQVRPRSAWAGGRQPVGVIADEPDVRYLLVHHTVTANTYAAADVPGIIRRIFDYHTGPKAWPDVAYNFMIDRFGVAWETRAGSLERTVAGDATGGNQGFDQKIAFLGDHSDAAPTDAAIDTMAALLAWLADRSGIDTSPGARTSFVSRGSNLHPAGTTVETATIAGHRVMSNTACPGDAGYRIVTDRLPAEATARRGGTPPSTAPPTGPPTTTASPPSSPSTSVAPAPTTATSVTSTTTTSVVPSTDTSVVPPSTVPPSSPTSAVAAPTTTTGPRTLPLIDDGGVPAWIAGVAGSMIAVVGGAIALRNRRS